jgi:sialic acid synthase SpsE/sugar phosphate isomerase/epimerase
MKIIDHVNSIKNNKDYKYVYVISEIGVNHNGCLKTALELISASKDAGVDAVKFQKRNLSEIYTQEILDDPNSAEWNIDYLIPILKEVELSESDYETIKRKCDDLDIELIITPFDMKSAKFCKDLDVDAFKISSSEMVNFNLIEYCANFCKPLIISTGMWTEREIRYAVEEYKKIKEFDFFMLLANSTYPTPYESLNIKFLSELKKIHHLIGYSGHERGTFIPIAAQALGAQIVEKHITFDRRQTGPDHKASMLPSEFKEMVSNIRSTSLSMGKAKIVNQSEKLAKESFAKSAYANKKIKKGHLLTKNDFIFKSPGKGLHVHEIQEYLGKEVKSTIKKGECISDKHFQKIVEIKDWCIPNFSKNWGVKCRFHDFGEYKKLKSPVVEFHCSETDIDTDFKTYTKETQLIMHAPEIFGRNLVDICSDDKYVVEESISLLQKSIDKTIEMSKYFNKKKPKFVVHLGGMSLNHVIEENCNELFLERAIDNFSKLKYNKSDIDILPENLPPRPWYLGGQWFQYGFMHPEDMIRFCNHYNLKMTYDICHAQLFCNHQKTSLEDYTKKVMSHVSHLHISDAHGIDGEGLQIGEGCVDFDKFFKNIEDCKNNDYTWVTEIWSGHLNHGSGCRQSMHNLSKYKKIL